MTKRAGLELVCLIVERRGTRRGEVHGIGVALQAQSIDVVHIQHAWVGRTVGVMTENASLSLDRRMLINERSCIFYMTLDANLVLRRSRAQLRIAKCSVWIVTIRALHQTFIDAVMKRTIEIRLDVRVAGVAERGLGRQK